MHFKVIFQYKNPGPVEHFQIKLGQVYVVGMICLLDWSIKDGCIHLKDNLEQIPTALPLYVPPSLELGMHKTKYSDSLDFSFPTITTNMSDYIVLE